jgi:NAD(P)-dependent dehydrogenase (short-subunit alcohol dehydrogenase family)
MAVSPITGGSAMTPTASIKARTGASIKASARPPDAARPLAGRHAFITGASRGIGAAIARELGRLGAELTLVARGEAALRTLGENLRGSTTARIGAIAADVTNGTAMTDAIARASAAFGSPSILINNAGGAESASFARTDAALWRRMIELNLTSVYLATHAVAPAMVASGYGRIVNVASTAGLRGYPYVSAYVAAKHGVVGLTRALAIEFATTGVTVNAVCPGYTDTPMLDAAVANIAAKTRTTAAAARANLAAANPMGRLIRPEEVAAVVGWLCLDEAASITGQAVAIAGGEVT